jgi:stalled ribosome rescue protein Dom34
MSQHAIVFIDHEHAKVFHLDGIDAHGASLKQHAHHKSHSAKHKVDGKAQHDHKLFEEVVKEMQSAQEILVVGPGTAKNELIHHIEQKAKNLQSRICAVEAVDHPTDKQLVALAKQRFKTIDMWR